MPYSYKYARPALTVDVVVFGLDEGDLKVLLIERDLEPFRGRWALPGGSSRSMRRWRPPPSASSRRRRASATSTSSSSSPSAPCAAIPASAW